MRAALMQDNSDVQEMRSGLLTDMRIESLLAVIYASRWDEPDFDELYTEIVAEFIDEDTPTLLPSIAGTNPQTCQALMYLSLFKLDYTVIHKHGAAWPGDFEYLPEATCAVQIIYPEHNQEDEELRTSLCPGITINQAVLAVIIQLTRELSEAAYNKGGANSVH